MFFFFLNVLYYSDWFCEREQLVAKIQFKPEYRVKLYHFYDDFIVLSCHFVA